MLLARWLSASGRTRPWADEDNISLNREDTRILTDQSWRPAPEWVTRSIRLAGGRRLKPGR